MATQSLGPGGEIASDRVVVPWPWYGHVPGLEFDDADLSGRAASQGPWHHRFSGLGLWGIVVLLLVGLKENRTWQAWLVLIPLGLAGLVWRVCAWLLALPTSAADAIEVSIMAGAVTLVFLLLVEKRLTREGGRFLEANLVLVGVGAASHAAYFGLASGTGGLTGLFLYALGGSTALAALDLAGRACRGACSRGRFLGWLGLWVLVAAVVFGSIYAVVASLLELVSPAEALLVLVPCLAASAVLWCVIYLAGLPLFLLAFDSPFYRERLLGLLGPRGAAGRGRLQWALGALAGSGPAEPTARPVTAADVARTWQFYLDELGRTVVVDLLPDGTFAQRFLSNRDGVTACPGGTWRLEGPRVHLANYVCARTGGAEARTWWMIDAPGGLGLFGGDGAEAASYFRMSPRERSLA